MDPLIVGRFIERLAELSAADSWSWPRVSRLARFCERIQVDETSGCWSWRGHRRPDGYGTFSLERVPRLAHRISYGFFVGRIPDGLTLDHLCKNTSCVNPGHMEPVTRGENSRRGDNHNRRKTHCAHGHEFTPENTIRRDGQRKCRICARGSVSRYKRRKRLGLSLPL